MPRPGHRRRTATGPGSSGRPVLIETLVEAAPPRPCDAAGLLDEMSGSTLGPRDPGADIEGVAGRKSEKREDAAHQGSDAAPARPVADAVRAGAGDLLGDAGFSIRRYGMTGSQSYRRRARARDKVAEAAYDTRVDTDRGVRAADEGSRS